MVHRLHFDVRQALRGDDGALGARLRDALRRRLEIEILRGEPLFERCELAIAKAAPPLRIRLGVGRAAAHVARLGSERVGRDDRRRDEVGADRASRKSERGDGAKDERAHRLPLRDARRRTPLLVNHVLDPVWIVVSTEKPTRKSFASGWFGSTVILTGKRCTIFVKLPVALLGWIGAKEAPVAGAMLSTVPWRSIR